jgi:hypothetical protein
VALMVLDFGRVINLTRPLCRLPDSRPPDLGPDLAGNRGRGPAPIPGFKLPGPGTGARFGPGPGLWSRFCGARARAAGYLSTLGGALRLGVVLAPHNPLHVPAEQMSEPDEAAADWRVMVLSDPGPWKENYSTPEPVSPADFEISDDDSKEGSDISELVSTR